MTEVSTARLASIFVEVADTLVEEFDLIDFLHMLTDRTANLFGVAAVGLMLADKDGRLDFIAGSTENVRLLELFQLQNRQGPCFEAFQAGRPVVNADLDHAVDRWPQFAPRATATGFKSVYAFPLRLRAHTIGALNVFSDTVGVRIGDADVPVIQALADVAAIALLQERAIRRSEVLTEQLQGALNSRIVIEQAKGAVAQALGISVDEAFTRIRAYARSHDRRLTEIAHTIMVGGMDLPALG